MNAIGIISDNRLIREEFRQGIHKSKSRISYRESPRSFSLLVKSKVVVSILLSGLFTAHYENSIIQIEKQVARNGYRNQCPGSE
jgi:hypothetical protein